MSRTLGLLSLLAAAGALPGCGTDTAGMMARHGMPPPGASWSGEVLASEPDLAAGRVLTLARAVEIALRHHPDGAAGRSAAELASAQVGQALSAYLPQGDASASVTRGTSNTFVDPNGAQEPLTSGLGRFSQGSDVSAESRSAQAGLSQLLLDGGRTSAAVRQGRAQARGAALDWEAARQGIAFSAREAYVAALRDGALLRVAEASLDNVLEHLALARRLREVGRRSAYDVTRAEVDAANARLARLQALTALAVSRARLNQALGLEEDPGYLLEEDVPVAPLEIPLEAALAQARLSRPDLRAALAALEAAEASVDGARAGYRPTLSLTGSFTLSGATSPPVRNWSAGPVLSWNWLNGFRTRHEVEAAEAQLRERRARVAAAEQRAAFEVRQAHLGLAEASERMALADRTVGQAGEGLALAEARYRTGQGTLLELADARLALARASGERVQARAAHETGAAALIQAMGLLSAPAAR